VEREVDYYYMRGLRRKGGALFQRLREGETSLFSDGAKGKRTYRLSAGGEDKLKDIKFYELGGSISAGVWGGMKKSSANKKGDMIKQSA